VRTLASPLLPSPHALRSRRAVGWLGLLGFLWAAVGLPAAHALEHAREASADARADDVHLLLRQIIHGREPVTAHHHHHGDAPTDPSAPDPAHGRGSLQHFAVALLATEPPRVPPRADRVAELERSLPATAPPAQDVRSPRSTRGPPALAES
jgi:hypothetical protein